MLRELTQRVLGVLKDKVNGRVPRVFSQRPSTHRNRKVP